MGNYIYAILRVLGTKEERDKYIEYVMKVVPTFMRSKDYQKEIGENIPSKMDKWYQFENWENECGTFCIFFTINSELFYNDGYQLHKKFPQLKFIYRAIDEGWPNHCRMWEFCQEDEISDEKEKFYETKYWWENALGMLSWTTNGFSDENIRNVSEQLIEKYDGDRLKAKIVVDDYQNDQEKFGDFMKNSMSDAFKNDEYFKLSDEELVNSPGIPPCTLTWKQFKNI